MIHLSLFMSLPLRLLLLSLCCPFPFLLPLHCVIPLAIPFCHSHFVIAVTIIEICPFLASITCDQQGFQKPQGYVSKGTEGKGKGRNFMILAKPLPLSRVVGY